ncbi:alpha/beta fold hydrolase [Tenacibaculum sp. M341]|uniref:alpha/beta fold hydrolase n=1 Tax=Tenacibaculum sp. M341 TaxID=2530339 RepID=UPI0010481EBB|nr:alpha/beta hydrolase [Tenacibaculum sp. M341]TCI85834.1 alpha/beta hydrolase [Tenacibaculum sp. M341]
MEKSIVFKKAKISYYVYGENHAKSIVLLHGFLENSTMWNTVVDCFSKKYKIVSVDLLGHGNTECLGYIHTMEEIAATVFEVLKAEEIMKTTLIGHSMGGYVALAFIEKYANYVNQLCLLNSTSRADSEERKQIRDRSIQMAKTNYKPLVSMSISNLFSSDKRSDLKKEIEVCREEALKTSVQGYIACAEGMKLRKDRTQILASFSGKKLIISGKNDPVISYDAIVKEANQTASSLITLPNGHMSHIEDSEELLKNLKEFVEMNELKSIS